MDFHGPDFVVVIIAMSICGWIITTWIRARHGYPIENEFGGMVGKEGALPNQRQIDLLAKENATLSAKVSRLEERITVLERIATDKPLRLADEIATLR